MLLVRSAEKALFRFWTALLIFKIGTIFASYNNDWDFTMQAILIQKSVRVSFFCTREQNTLLKLSGKRSAFYFWTWKRHAIFKWCNLVLIFYYLLVSDTISKNKFLVNDISKFFTLKTTIKLWKYLIFYSKLRIGTFYFGLIWPYKKLFCL